MANAILAQVHGTYLDITPERAPADTAVSHKCTQEGEPEEEEEPSTIILPGPLTETSFVESLVAYHIKGITDCISEEVLGIDRKLSAAS